MNVAKKLKVESEVVSVDHFTSLIDECIFNILRRLDLDSLCATKKTCRKLQNLVGELFQRKYSDASVCILEYRDDIGLQFLSNIEHGKCFSRYITNLYTVQWPEEDPDDEYSEVIQCINSNISDSLKRIAVTVSSFSDSLGTRIAHTLKNVETVCFQDVRHEVDPLIDNILKHCHHLKHLKFDNPVVLKSLKKYPELEYLDFAIDDNEFNQPALDYLKDFLHLNPHLRQLNCRFEFKFKYPVTDLDVRHVSTYINSIVDCAKNLDTLFLQISKGFDASQIYGALNKLNECKNIKKLELNLIQQYDYEMINLNKLARLSKLSALYLSNITDDKIIHHIDYFANLTFLYLSCTKIPRKIHQFVNVSQKLQNLEELYCCLEEEHEEESWNSTAINDILILFARYAPKIKKIVTNCYLKDDKHSISLFSEERAKLIDACNCLIYFYSLYDQDFKDYEEHRRSILSRNRKDGLVKFMPVKYIESYFDNIDHPYIPGCLKETKYYHDFNIELMN